LIEEELMTTMAMRMTLAMAVLALAMAMAMAIKGTIIGLKLQKSNSLGLAY
jgi:hypothetical protein